MQAGCSPQPLPVHGVSSTAARAHVCLQGLQLCCCECPSAFSELVCRSAQDLGCLVSSQRWGDQPKGSQFPVSFRELDLVSLAEGTRQPAFSKK